MKNILKLFLGLSLALAVVACDTENVGTIYDSTNGSSSDIVFARSTTSYIFGSEDPDQVVIPLWRSNATEAYTPTISGNHNTELFTITVAEFAAGSYESTATITFDRYDLQYGKKNVIKLAIENDHTIAGQKLSHEVTIVRDYVWLDFDTATMKSGFLEWGFEFTETLPCEVIKVEGLSLYRIMDPYGPLGADPGCYIEFTYENGEIVPTGEKDAYGDMIFDSGLDVGAGTNIHFYLNEADITYANKVITADVEHYMPKVGGYDHHILTFTLTKDLE